MDSSPQNKMFVFQDSLNIFICEKVWNNSKVYNDDSYIFLGELSF